MNQDPVVFVCSAAVLNTSHFGIFKSFFISLCPPTQLIFLFVNSSAHQRQSSLSAQQYNFQVKANITNIKVFCQQDIKNCYDGLTFHIFLS